MAEGGEESGFHGGGMTVIRHLAIGTAFVVGLAASVNAQTVLYVDADSPNDGPGNDWAHAYHDLQDALTAAAFGDVIRVAAGTYHPDEDQDHPTGTGDRGATFQLQGGVEIHGGYAGFGAADPDERDIRLYESILSGDIGATRVDDDNSYHVVSGIGTDSTAVLDGFTVTAGRADGALPDHAGGGMIIETGSPTLANCTFSGNWAAGGGGMLIRWYSNPTLINCTFSGNSAIDGGGMLNQDYSNPTLTNCTFTGNSADEGGGMLNRSHSNSTLTNCTFTGNSAVDGGGLLNRFFSTLALTNCTFTGNLAEAVGGAMFTEYGSSTMVNCILWGNTAQEAPQIYDPGHTNIATYSCIQDETAKDENIYPGMGNIDDNPLFVDADGSDDMVGTPDDDVRLRTGSPCIDAGDNDAPGLVDVNTDLDGGLRRIDDPDTPDTGNPGAPGPPVVDMGAYEYWPDCNDNEVPDADDIAAGTSADCNINTRPDECEPGGLEDCNSNGAPDLCDIFNGDSEDCNANAAPDECDLAGGTSEDRDADGIPDDCEPVHNITQDTIHPAIQEAIDAAMGGDEIEVGPGTLVERINLLGKVITLRSTAGPDVTIIDGDAGGSVITCANGEGPDTLIEGFTFANGRADNGGGMYNSGSNPTVVNCVFSQNFATGSYPDGAGGGMYNHDASPTLIGCTFIGNGASSVSSQNLGGGMYNNEAAPTLIDCTFRGNASDDDGGGMYNLNSSPTLTNCSFSGNSASVGGGMYNNQSSPTLIGCTFNMNSAGYGGGMFNVQYSDPMLSHCTFSSNAATDWGGGMGNWDTSSPTVSDCTFSGNSALVGGGILNNTGSSPALYNCKFSENSAASGGGVCNIQQSDPTLTNCIFTDNAATGAAPDGTGGGMYNWDSSPTSTNCTFSGNAAGAGGGAIHNESYLAGSHPALANSVLWGNAAPIGPQIHDDARSATTATYSCIQDEVSNDGVVYPGDGNMDVDPLFVPGPVGCYYLSQIAAGNPQQSPCVDAGSDTAANLGLDATTTRSDEATDTGVGDMGYHYPVTGVPLIMGDYDRTGDVNLADFGALQICFTNGGPAEVSPCCRIFDFESDADVDLDDYLEFVSAFEQ